MTDTSRPVSQPVVPPQPSTEFFSIQDLALFKSYSRESYRAAFGVEAAAYDPSRLRKSRFDSTVDVSDPANVAIYYIAAKGPDGNGSLRQMVLPAQEAATVNLPGRISYPPYVVSPTLATRGGSTLNAIYLSLESDAQALMKELGRLHNPPGWRVRKLWCCSSARCAALMLPIATIELAQKSAGKY